MIASVITPATTAPLVACRKRQKIAAKKSVEGIVEPDL